MTDTDIETPEEHADRMERTREAMAEAGVPIDEALQVDYFGFEETESVYMPDGKSFVLIKALNEAGRRAYLNKVNREVRIAKQTGDAVMQLANGSERQILLTHAVCGWNFVARDKLGNLVPVPYSDRKLMEWLEKANPNIVDIVDKAVRKQNPWLMADVTLEDLLAQREELDEQIEKKRAEEEGKES